MDFLGVDLGTSCGWARIITSASSDVLTSGTFNLKPTKSDSESVRNIKLKRNVEKLLEDGVEHVWYEKVMRHNGVIAAHVYGGLMYSLHEICDQYRVPCEGLSVQRIKLHATGKGNASKTMMCDAFARETGRLAETDDEADAYFVLKYGMSLRK